jgi:hypothetical protein
MTACAGRRGRYRPRLLAGDEVTVAHRVVGGRNPGGRYLAIILDGLRPSRATLTALPELLLSLAGIADASSRVTLNQLPQATGGGARVP